MNSRERVMTALKGGLPDAVPWVENDIEESMMIKLMGRSDFTPPELCELLGMDGFGYHYPSGGGGAYSQALQTSASVKDAFYHPKNITFDFIPPWIAEMGVEPSGRTFVKKGLLTDREALKYFDEFLPDPNHQARYDAVADWLAKYKGDYAVFARIRNGGSSTFQSVGLENFSYMMYDDPDLLKEIHRRFSEWCAKVVENINKMDFDFIWCNDDHADNINPWVNTEMYEEFMLPYQKIVADAIKKPWVFHSCGNILPILDSVKKLGFDALHPIQPRAMDIYKLKKERGHEFCIVGNLDLDYLLPKGSTAEVEAEVKKLIEEVGQGAGFVLSSANSIPDYVKVDNVFAVAEAHKKYMKC